MTLTHENSDRYGIGLLVFLKFFSYYCNMEIKELHDFYIDLDGDIKATINDTTASFITETNKLNSEYIIAANLDDIKNIVREINPGFNVDITPLKQYSVKRDADGVLKAVKIFMDHTEVTTNGSDIILKGVEFVGNKIYSDYYFLATPETVAKLIKDNNFSYRVTEYDTHEPILYSIKYQLCVSGEDCAEGAVNFKTYYVKKEAAPMYNRDFAKHLKESLKFF
jgi:hypothetical protein